MAYHISRDEFDRLVEEALVSIPRRYRPYFRNVTILVEDYPANDDDGLSAIPKGELLGLFRGYAYPDRGGFFDIPAPVPDAIILYQRNIEAICDCKGRLVEEIRLTLLHEIGHYFGMTEEELEEY